MKINFKAFVSNFQPLNNNNQTQSQEDSYQKNILHLTNTEHFDLIQNNISERKVWSIDKGQNDSLIAIPGKKYNAIGYLVTEKPYHNNHIENLRIIIDPGYEHIKPSDISYLQMVKDKLQNEEFLIEVNEEIFSRVIKFLCKKL